MEGVKITMYMSINWHCCWPNLLMKTLQAKATDLSRRLLHPSYNGCYFRSLNSLAWTDLSQQRCSPRWQRHLKLSRRIYQLYHALLACTVHGSFMLMQLYTKKNLPRPRCLLLLILPLLLCTNTTTNTTTTTTFRTPEGYGKPQRWLHERIYRHSRTRQFITSTTAFHPEDFKVM